MPMALINVFLMKAVHRLPCGWEAGSGERGSIRTVISGTKPSSKCTQHRDVEGAGRTTAL